MDDLSPFTEPEPTPALLAAESQPAPPARTNHHPVRRTAATLLLAAGLFGIGGASVVLAATPTPSASTSPSTQHSGGPVGAGGMPGGCTHNGTNGSSGSGSSGSSSSPSSSS